MTELHHLTDDELVARIASLNRAEREATAALVAHLAELESRDLHLARGFRSLYGYCRAVLHLSEHESYNRMEAAKVARRFPAVVPMLAAGLLHLTAVRLLAPHLGDENHLALLGGAIHKSKMEVKGMLAAWFPKPDVRTSIRRVAAPVGEEKALAAASGDVLQPLPVTGSDQREPVEQTAGSGPPGKGPLGAPAATTPPPERRKASLDPLSADSYAMRLTARRATIERLRRAQELLSHAVPDGDVDEILFRALGALIEREERGGRTARQRSAPRKAAARTVKPASRRIPADVEHEVRARDGARCAFVSSDGRRCEERRFLELHHLKPWIAGGSPTATNIALRCRAHNAYEWRVYVAPIRAARELMATRSGTS